MTLSFFFIPMQIIFSQNNLLTIGDAINYALQNNYAIKIAQSDSSSSALNLIFKNAALYPRVNANAGTVWYNQSQKQILADNSIKQKSGLKSNNLNTQLAINWTLFDGLRMFTARDLLNENLNLDILALKNQAIQTVSNVILTYYNIVRQKQQLKATSEQMKINEERLKLAQYKLDIGTGTKPDVLQSKIDLNAQLSNILQTKAFIEKLKQQLNQLITKDIDNLENLANINYEVDDSIPLNLNLTLSDIQEQFAQKNYSLKMFNKNIELAKLNYKLITQQKWPTINFNANYNFSRTLNHTVINSFSTLLNRIEGPNLGFTAIIPIFNNYTIKLQAKQQQIKIQQQQLLLNNQKSILNLYILNYYADYDAQRKILLLEEENILLAKENVSIIFKVYKLSSTTYIQLREAQKSLEDAYNRLIAAKYNTKIAETNLLLLTGQLIK